MSEIGKMTCQHHNVIRDTLGGECTDCDEAVSYWSKPQLETENAKLTHRISELEKGNEKYRDIFKEVDEWIDKRSGPNGTYSYSRCIVCSTTWHSHRIEQHNFDCWIPRFKNISLLTPDQALTTNTKDTEK